MALDESKNEDELYNINEVEILIDESVLPYTEESKLDFINDERGQGFILGPVDESQDQGCC